MRCEISLIDTREENRIMAKYEVTEIRYSAAVYCLVKYLNLKSLFNRCVFQFFEIFSIFLGIQQSIGKAKWCLKRLDNKGRFNMYNRDRGSYAQSVYPSHDGYHIKLL